MPPIPPPMAGVSFSSLGSSTTTDSVVVRREDTLAASTKAVLITFNGSIMPAFTISTYSPVAYAYPRSGLSCSNSLPTTTAPSTPALEAIV
nr:hypothetical protein Iba_chr13cCG0620 [Ipomoea batatas]